MMRRSAGQLSHWLTTAEQFMAFKTGRVEFESERRNLVTLVRDMLHHESLDCPNRNVHVRASGLEELNAEVDVEFFELMVSSLVREAVGHCPDDSDVSVHLHEHPEGRACVTVTRSGEPIDAELMPKIFELFASPDDLLNNRSDAF